MFSCKENRKGRRYFLHGNSLAGYSTVSAAKSAAAPLKHDWTARESQPDLTAENTWAPKSRASPKSFTYLMSPSVFWGGRRKGENTNKHYFQFLCTLHYSAEGQTYKAIYMSTSGGFTSGELHFVGQQLCYQQALTAATAIIKLPLPFPAGTSREWKNKTETKQKMRTRECFRNDFS